jgi:hypothetical protein
MKINFLLLAIIIATVSSCSTSYKTGQTPDDVYYSPARLQNNEVRKEKNKEEDVYYTTEDRDTRRQVSNRRYRRYDRYDTYERYNYPYGYYNNYPPVYGNSKYGTLENNSQPRKSNLGAYSPNPSTPDSSNIYNPKFGRPYNGSTTNPVRTFGNQSNSSSNNGSGFGNMMRRVFSNSNNSNNTYNPGNSTNNNYSSPSRTFESRSNNSSNNNNNSSSNNTKSAPTENKSSGSAPVRKF